MLKNLYSNNQILIVQAFQNTIFFSGLIFSGKFFNSQSISIALTGYILLCILSFSIIKISTFLTDTSGNDPSIGGKNRFLMNLVSTILILGILGIAFHRNNLLGILVFFYTVIAMSHDLFMKDLVIVDVLGSGVEFSLKASIGAAILNTRISPWLIICTFLLALMVTLGQRRNEILRSTEPTNVSRKVLTKYTPKLLDQMIAVVTSSTILAYSLYTISTHPLKSVQSIYLVYTIIFVLYGVMRFIYLAYTTNFERHIEFELFTDKPLIGTFFIWLFSVILIMVFRI